MAKKKLINITHIKKALFSRRCLKKIVSVFSFLLVLPFLYYITLTTLFYQRIYPNVMVADINLGGYKIADATNILKENRVLPNSIVFSKEGTLLNNDLKVDATNLGLSYNYPVSIDKAYITYRSSDLWQDFLLKFDFLKDLTYKQQIKLPLVVLYDQNLLDNYLTQLSSQIANDPVYPSINVINGRVSVDKGTSGQELNRIATKEAFVQNISWLGRSVTPIIINDVDVTLSPAQVQIATDRSNTLFNRKLTASFDGNSFSYTKATLIKFVNPRGGFYPDEIASTIKDLAKQVEREPQNPVFKYEEGLVKEFLPALDGVRVNTDSLSTLFINTLERLEKENQDEIVFNIPVTKTPPPNQTEDVNSLGIKELIGAGVSYFKGSIPGRIHNVILAASKLNGILIAPDETLSFNKILGDVSLFTGYQQAYIIKDGKTVLGDGGGVCQVSTTLFRAALDAGLPIIERRAHAYRVAYYEQYSPPGIDATVYDPTSDLKIKNNTTNHLLIQTTVDKKALKLTFEIYGTKDGRVVEITKPIVSKPVPPPEDLYTDDPTLPSGQVKQIDWKAWGAKVTFNYKVIRGQETLFEKTFISNYQPWQAKFLRGTGPAI